MVRSDAVKIAGYQHFLRLADRIQWDDEAHRPHRRRRRLADRRRRAHRGARRRASCVGEAGVAEHLHAFFDGDAAATFEAQRVDEERHARFFARYAQAVGLDDPRAHVSAEFVELFERAAARRPRRRRGVEAVGLYHMVLEGVVFTAGQSRCWRSSTGPAAGAARRAWSSCCATRSWHVGFGTRCLNDAQLSDAEATRSSTRASAPRRCGRPSRPSAVLRDAAPAHGGGRVEAGDEGAAGRRAGARLPARRARLGRAVAGLPGAAGRAATGRRALLYSRAGHGLVRRARTPTARRASCTRRRSRSSRRCCDEHGIERPVLSATATAARSR